MGRLAITLNMLSTLIRIIDGHCNEGEEVGIHYKPNDPRPAVAISIEYRACREIAKEWSELLEILSKKGVNVND